jgi:hypothetical protein
MNDGVREWLIRVCFVLIACTAIWTVFGDDLLALLGKT